MSSLDEVRRLIDIVADAGVNLIDTANVYSGGALGRDDRRGDADPQARHADRDQGALSRWARGRTIAACRAGI